MSTLIYPNLNLKDPHFKAFKISDDFIETTNGKLDVNEITYYIEQFELDNHNGNIPYVQAQHL